MNVVNIIIQLVGQQVKYAYKKITKHIYHFLLLKQIILSKKKIEKRIFLKSSKPNNFCKNANTTQTNYEKITLVHLHHTNNF